MKRMRLRRRCCILHATAGTCSVKRLQGLDKDVLSEILALLPVPGQAIDGMEDQVAVQGDQGFDLLGSRQRFHPRIPFRGRTVVLQNIMYTYLDA